MMGLKDIRDLVSSLFIMLNKDKFILFRIEFLVVLVTLLFLAMFIMDIFRRHIHSSIMKAIFSLFDAVSDSIVTYLLGAMQTAPFKNQLFPVWALVLVIFRHNIDFISGYGVPDRGGRRFTEWRNVIKLLGSAFLNWTRGSRFERPLWTLWVLQILRSWYRLWSHTLASNSVWHGDSSELVSEYMRADNDPSKWKPDDCNPRTMEGYKYLVYEERVKIQKPRYVLNIDPSSKTLQSKNTEGKVGSNARPRRHLSAQEETTNPETMTKSSHVTLDNIWRCRGHLLNADPDHARSEDSNQGNALSRLLRCGLPCCNNSKNKTQGNEQKDLSMAFALSRLLRCRLEDVVLPKNMYPINRELIKTKIIEEQNVKRAFGIMELQLAYVNDYFNTRYPMVFWRGLRSLTFSLLQSMVTFGVVLWLSVDIRRVYKPPDGELAHLVKGVNVDMIITWVFMFFMMFKEIWEMVTYLLSDWTRLLLVCMYAKCKCNHFMTRCLEKTILSFFTSKITAKRWHGLLDQYVFVQSYDDRPKVWNWLHKITTGMVPKKEDGAKLSSAIPVPDCVRSYILVKLHDILEQAISEKPSVNANRNSDEHTNRLSLPGSIKTLVSSERHQQYGWAYLQLQTSSQVILVWHIATSFCEMELAKNFDVDLSNPGFLNSILACFTSCCPSKRYLINVDEKDDDVHGNHSSNSCFTCSPLSSFRNCFSSESTEKKLSEELKERYIVANSLSRYCAYLLVSKPDLIPDSFLVPQIVFQKLVKSARDGNLRSCDSLESRHNKLSLEAYKAAEDPDSVKMGNDVVKQGAMLGKHLAEKEDCWQILADVWTELIIHIAPTWNAEAHKKCLESGGEFITLIWALLWHCGIEKSKLWPEEDDASENNVSTDHAIDAGNNNINNAGTETANYQTRGVVPEIEEVSEDVTGEDLDVETGMARRTHRRVKSKLGR